MSQVLYIYRGFKILSAKQCTLPLPVPVIGQNYYCHCFFYFIGSNISEILVEVVSTKVLEIFVGSIN